MKVCILLSTYNGEKYLEEQLESLIKQENVEIDILVRDDGSSDNTHNILNKWQERGLLKWYTGNNKGYAKSFMDLALNSGDYDYYAFCDQDDIWLPNKLAIAIKCISTLQSSIKLYCSNTFYYKNGENLGLIKKVRPKYNIYTCLVQNIATGCTIVFNKKLKDIITEKMPEYLIAHDFWVYQVAMIFGEVYYDENSYIYYRQHDNNQIGAKTAKTEIWKRRINSFFFSKKEYGISLQAKELLNCYSGNINLEEQRIISAIANYKDNLWNRIKLIFDSRFVMWRTMNTVLLKLKIIFGRL